MLYLVAYDTEDDQKRLKLAELLKDMGGHRIQYSAFLIDLNQDTLARLASQAKQILAPARARIYILPVCRRDLERIITLAHNYTQPWDEDTDLL